MRARNDSAKQMHHDLLSAVRASCMTVQDFAELRRACKKCIAPEEEDPVTLANQRIQTRQQIRHDLLASALLLHPVAQVTPLPTLESVTTAPPLSASALEEALTAHSLYRSATTEEVARNACTPSCRPALY